MTVDERMSSQLKTTKGSWRSPISGKSMENKPRTSLIAIISQERTKMMGRIRPIQLMLILKPDTPSGGAVKKDVKLIGDHMVRTFCA